LFGYGGCGDWRRSPWLDRSSLPEGRNDAVRFLLEPGYASLLEEPDEMEVLRLDPDAGEGGERFHHFAVVGRTRVAGRDRQRAVAAGVYGGIIHGGPTLLCF